MRGILHGFGFRYCMRSRLGLDLLCDRIGFGFDLGCDRGWVLDLLCDRVLHMSIKSIQENNQRKYLIR